ncbi:MAG: histidinol-phosphate transaminase [Bacteroidota bacterium]
MILIPKHVQELNPYKPGQSPEEIRRVYGIPGEIIKLASNENPLGPSPKAVERVREAAGDIHLYPNAGWDLREKLAEKYTIPFEYIIAADGSESVLGIALHTFLDREKNDHALTCFGTFVGFNTQTKQGNFKTKYAPLTSDYRFDVRALADAITDETKILYLANANNPTGTYFTKDEYEWLMERVPEHVLVIMDEAYFEYSHAIAPDTYPDALSYGFEGRFKNVLTMRTFSKVYGVAGTRVGYGIAHADIIAPMMKVKLPFEPNSLAQAAALGALEDDEFLKRTIDVNTRGVATLYNGFKNLGLAVAESVANFVMVDCGSPELAQEFYIKLLQKGIITRPLGGFSLPHCIRISTGTDEQNEYVVKSVAEIVKDLPQLSKV